MAARYTCSASHLPGVIMQRNRTLLTLAIIAFWLMMTGWLLWRHRGSPPALTPQAADSWPIELRDTRMGIFFGTDQVGTVHLQTTPELRHQRQGVRMDLDASMALTLFERSTDFSLTGEIWRPRQGEEAELVFNVRSGGYDLGIEGRVEGDRLQLEVRTAGERYPLHIPIDGSLLFSNGFGLTLQAPRLAVGEEMRLESFDPFTLQTSPTLVRCVAHETITVGGREIATRRLLVTTGGLRNEAWIDEEGAVVRARTPFGLTLELLDQQSPPFVPQPATKDAPLLAATAIVPTGLRPFRGARLMEILVTGGADLALPEDETQRRLASGRYRVALPSLDSAVPTAEAGTRIDDPTLLAADAFVQADHPRVRDQMVAIVGDEEGPWERARRLHDWVFTEIAKEAAISIPSALEVLSQRRGDCNEHTVLFTALARAAGLPTRIAIGLVWSEDHQGFYYHAWPEVYVGQWVWMDPTLGQPQADATHIKLLNGGIEQWPQLLAFLGRLEIEVAAVR